MNRLARMVELGLSPFGIIVVLLAVGMLLSLTRRRRRAGFRAAFSRRLPLPVVYGYSPGRACD